MRFANAGKENNELLTAEPSNRVVGADFRGNGVGDRFQSRVTGQVTVSAVDPPEVVEVDHQKAENILALAGPGQVVRRPVTPFGTRQQAGLLIFCDQILQFPHQHTPVQDHHRQQHEQREHRTR
jgi:hypothetical protein